MDPGNLRSFKDFLEVYNQITERCFNQCIEHTNSRQLSQNEIDCVDKCGTKFIRFNHRLITNFMKTQSEFVARREKLMEEQQQIIDSSNQQDDQVQQQEVVSIPAS